MLRHITIGQLTGQTGRRHVDLTHIIGHAIIGHRDGVRVKRVCGENIGSRIKILAMNLADHLRAGHAQQVVVALQGLRKLGEPLTTIIRLRQVITLDHGPHTTIQNQDALAQESRETLSIHKYLLSYLSSINTQITPIGPNHEDSEAKAGRHQPKERNTDRNKNDRIFQQGMANRQMTIQPVALAI